MKLFENYVYLFNKYNKDLHNYCDYSQEIKKLYY